MVQIKPTTHEEKVKMYMKCTKKELAEMLANRDAVDEVKIFGKKFTEAQQDIDPEIFFSCLQELLESYMIK